MSQESEETVEAIDLVALEEKSDIVKRLAVLPFGPCDITREAWRRLKLAVKANSAEPTPIEVPFALLGKLSGYRFVIEEVIQVTAIRTDAAKYDLQDVIKMGREAAKEGLALVGVLCTRVARSPVKPSQADKIAWLSIMFEFDRPLYYYIMSASLEVAAYSVPVQLFIPLKEAIRFLPVGVTEND
jgi:hypothetical protein